MTVGAWLTERESLPPERLLHSIEVALGARLQASRAEVSERCLEAAECLLCDLLRRATTGRDSALDLLTVDALVTYAFEAAAENPATLETRAHDAAQRLAAVTSE